MTFEDLDKELIKRHRKLIESIINAKNFLQLKRIYKYWKELSKYKK